MSVYIPVELQRKIRAHNINSCHRHPPYYELQSPLTLPINMIEKLTRKGEDGKWCPTSIDHLSSHLSLSIQENEYFSEEKIKAIKSNLAYNLQYLQFLDRILLDIKLTAVLKTQNIKSFVIYGASIIEAFFHYLVVSNGHGKTTFWKEYKRSKYQEYKLDNSIIKNEIVIYIKQSNPLRVEMTFHQMCQKVQEKKLLGSLNEVYTDVNAIRKLRNKLHIHGIANPRETDYNSFPNSELNLINRTIYGIFTSPQFDKSEYKQHFDYLIESL